MSKDVKRPCHYTTGVPIQQHPPDCCCCTDWPGVTVEDFAPPAGVDVDPILKELSVSRNDAFGNHLPIFDLLSHGQERLLDIRCVLGGGFQERDGQLIGKFLESSWRGWARTYESTTHYLCNAVLDHLLACQVGFVPYQQLVDTF